MRQFVATRALPVELAGDEAVVASVTDRVRQEVAALAVLADPMLDPEQGTVTVASHTTGGATMIEATLLIDPDAPVVESPPAAPDEPTQMSNVKKEPS